MDMWNNIRRIIQLYNDEEDNESVLIFAALLEEQNFYQKRRCRDSILQGETYVMEILNGHRERCYENFRMYPEVFRTLCSTLKGIGLKDSKFLTVYEQVAIFLLTLSHNQRNRVVAERFQHSTETISRHFHAVLHAVCQLGTHIIAPPNFSVIPNKIRESSRFYPYFRHCVGAIDGTHIPATLPASTQLPFRGRKGYTTQNVMAVCDFDMRFTYVLAGWEGSANDSRILNECTENEAMNFLTSPAGKYYLVDSGYANKPGYLAPFRGHTYHFQEYRRTRQPRRREEVFNHRHSSLRNIIERCFGLLKMRFAILRAMPPYKFLTQVLIVMACCTLHNFIKNQHQPDDIFDGNDTPQSDGEDDEIVEHVPSAQLREMDQLRNTIADQIWNSLQHS
ncbi:protein ALP1-like [Cornus florida]|uniref:protein ALP1-like n=1 Tax=Cornus florida TaxID=4283 RepID=UPI002897967F|nr:protein ALP1-like [Cornus florida]